MKASVLLLSLCGSLLLAVAPASAGKKDKEKEKEQAPAPPPEDAAKKKKDKPKAEEKPVAAPPVSDAEKKKKKKGSSEPAADAKKPEAGKPAASGSAAPPAPPPPAEKKGVPGAGFCTALQMDGKTVIDILAVPSDGKGIHNYVGCNAKLEDKIRPVMCPAGKKGLVEYMYKIGPNTPGKTTIYCKG